MVLQKPFASIQAAYYLASFDMNGGEAIPQAPQLDEKVEYDREYSADRSRMTESTAIPLREMDAKITTQLQDTINAFKVKSI